MDKHFNLGDMRRHYEMAGLDEMDLHHTPHEQMRLWLEQAADAGLAEPNAMVLSTATPKGEPSSRTVLLKAHVKKTYADYPLGSGI